MYTPTATQAPRDQPHKSRRVAGEKWCLYVILFAFLLVLARLHTAHVSVSYKLPVSNSIFYLENYDWPFSY